MPDNLSAQVNYEYEIRTGDFDNNGHLDVLIDRLTPGQLDGSMQSVILENSGGALTAKVPSFSELNFARTFALNSQITPRVTDLNIDYFADVTLEGLQTLDSALHDSYIVYASGEAGLAQPLGLKAVDEELKSFLGDSREWAFNKNHFIDQFSATIKPVFSIGWSCFSDQWYIPFDCHPNISVSGYISVAPGEAFSQSAADLANAYERIGNSGDYDIDNSADWWIMSSSFKDAMGVHAFGFRDDGTRVPTNFDHYAPDGYTGPVASREAMQFYLDLLFAVYWPAEGQAGSNGNLNTWVRHDYVVRTELCQIGDPACTVANGFCWMRRFPAPRADSENRELAEHGKFEELEGAPAGETNPIVTWVYEADQVLVNEVREGHVLYDPLQADGCGASHPNPIPDRCAVVVRRVYEDPATGTIWAESVGGGYNANLEWKEFNEWFGKRTFEDLQNRIEERIASGDQCPLQ